ncbi:MAG: DNA mismatch repair endonuclease MutL [Methanothrix sp.]|nr:MAG: DNA mismatch repair endonuclease MutL [Methanothrix sp.]
MHKIKLLDEDTINKIAAGEVIERPASAVKELVENAIDAGASRISVEVEDGGKSLIRVTDDGCGMDREDLPLAFQKHATSKIRDAGDLENIHTLGFRGEALASIASVSRSVEVRTRPRGSISGTYLRMENGRVVETKDTGCAEGTSITVWDLFYNVPARRKHLKGQEAELVYITIAVTEIAIINYTIAFDLFSGKRLLFKSVKSANWEDVLLRILGLKTLKALTPLQAEGRGWHLVGAAGDPLSTRSSSDRIFIFVNGRPVVSKALSSALRDSYRNIIPLGKSPVAVLSLEISPELVDVNVHPAKREIRLLREEEITAALGRAVENALMVQAKEEIEPEHIPGREFAPPKATITPSHEQRTLPLEIGNEAEYAVSCAVSGPPVSPVSESAAQDEARNVRIVGQILDLYIVAESEQGLMLIDQHAAAERIRFERLREKYRHRNIKQELAVPIALELSPSELIMMESWQETLSDIGFDIAPFGGNTVSVRSVPALGRRLENPDAVHDILRDLFSRGKVSPASTNREDILKLLACKGSIKSGKKLSMTEMQKILDDLFRCQNPLTCPHGRPVMIVMDQGHLERLFARR